MTSRAGTRGSDASGVGTAVLLVCLRSPVWYLSAASEAACSGAAARGRLETVESVTLAVVYIFSPGTGSFPSLPGPR